ncbi:MAG TPA: tetratricopeptide repeat protein [Planctomycetes bacterium]|nr:tetratricopeptide repeat protein [Planctomycetota bacterium]
MPHRTRGSTAGTSTGTDASRPMRSHFRFSCGSRKSRAAQQEVTSQSRAGVRIISKMKCFTLAAALLFCAVSCGGDGSFEAHENERKGRPNLLLITIDTVRADHLGAYGATEADTPVIDSLAAEGTLFEEAYSPAPMTLPAHATLLTGLLPPQHGARVNGVHKLDGDLVTLAERLVGEGYRTGAFVAAFVLSRRFGLDQGFEVFDDDLDGAYEQEVPSELARYRPGDRVVDSALAWLARTVGMGEGRPFFLWVHLYDAHFPWHAHGDREGTEGSYDGEIAFVDEQVGRLRSWFAENGLADNTLVALVADHGEGLGDHHETEHAYLLNEEVLRVPWILAGPGVPAGLRIDTLVSMEDFEPTVMELLGIENSGVQGRSLVPALRGEDLESADAYAETDLPWTSYRWAPQRSLTTVDWKYIRTPQTELYDRKNDRAEYVNLAGVHPEVVAELEMRLAAMEERLGSRFGAVAELDSQELERLADLGYAAGAGSDVPGADDANGAPDVKERLALKDLEADLRRGLALKTIGPLQHLEIARRLVDGAPETPSFRRELGDALLELGRGEEAVAAYEEAVAMVPKDAGLHYSIGDTLQQLGRAGDARPHIELALELEPKMPQAHVAMGNILRDEGRSDLAAGFYTEALRLRPEYPEAHYNLGMSFLDRDLPDRALVEFEKALDERDGWPIAHRAIALIQFQAGRFEEALEHYRACIDFLPGDVDSHLNMGGCLRALGRPEEAADVFSSAAQAVPGDFRPHLARANLAFDFGSESIAIEEYRATLAIAPDHLEAGARLARLLATASDPSLRRPDLALQLAEHAAEVTRRSSPRILDILSLAYAASGRWGDALGAAREARSLAEAGGLTDLIAPLDARITELSSRTTSEDYREPESDPH